MQELLIKLVRAANKLDSLGLYNDADTIDLIIRARSERPRAVEDFIQALKKAFENVAISSVSPGINKDSLPEIISIINILAEHGNFINPSVSSNTLSVLNDEAYTVADNLIELKDSIDKIKKLLNTDLDDEAKRQLQLDLSSDQKKLDEYLSKVDSWKSGRRKDDAEKYNKLQEILKERNR